MIPFLQKIKILNNPNHVSKFLLMGCKQLSSRVSQTPLFFSPLLLTLLYSICMQANTSNTYQQARATPNYWSIKYSFFVATRIALPETFQDLKSKIYLRNILSHSQKHKYPDYMHTDYTENIRVTQITQTTPIFWLSISCVNIEIYVHMQSDG